MTNTTQNRYSYTVACEAFPCALYAGDWADAYAAIAELHGSRPLTLRVIGGHEDDWMCPLSPTLPATGEVAAEIAKFGYIVWDVRDEFCWTPRNAQAVAA